MTFELKRIQFNDGFSILMITLNTKVKCFVDIDELIDKIIPNTIHKRDRNFCYNMYELEDGNIGAFYSVLDISYDAIAKDVEEVLYKYFNVIN